MTINLYEGLDALPAHLTMYIASDFATMEPKKGRKEPDYTEHGVMGFDHRGDMWFVDWWSGQKETDKTITAWMGLVKRWKPQRAWNEGGLIEKAIGPAIRREMRENQRWVSIESLTSIQDKGAKLQSFHARVTGGTVHFPVKRKWADEVIDQLIKFPTGRFDDKADVCGLFGRGLDLMNDARIPIPDRTPVLVPFTEKWIEYNDSANKRTERYF